MGGFYPPPQLSLEATASTPPCIDAPASTQGHSQTISQCRQPEGYSFIVSLDCEIY